MLAPAQPGKDGFLVTGSNNDFWYFNPERKLVFLTLLNKYWPDVSRCCREIGIHTTTFANHLKRDVKFSEAVQQIKISKLDEIEAVSAESARDQKRGFLDRAMILRAHRPELYDRAKVVKIEGYKMDTAERLKRLGAVETVIDSEISKTYLDRKQRREAKQAKRLTAGGGAAGEQGAGGAGDAKP